MTYLALARKWRPKTFAEVVGQMHVVQALSNSLDSGRVHHAFLFTGTRGVGKTTLARIFSKSLNCETGSSAEPCQQCGTCEAIDEGRYVDLIEVDAASRTKVDDTRELLENVQYAPTVGKYKVYLIDEVHMLSGHSFNALLKTLEEPPEHVKFLFATTDPQKLPITVLSRCLQFNLRAMRPEQIENQLVKIVSSEQIEFDQSALASLANAADGSMRDGLSLLDQAIAQGGGSVRQADVATMLGTLNSAHSNAILTALLNQDASELLNVVADMADSALDFAIGIDEVLMQLYAISVMQLAPSSSSVAMDSNTALIEQFAESIEPATIQLYYQIGLISKRDIALAPSLRVGFEMAILRMIAFEPEAEGSVSVSVLSTTEANSTATNNSNSDVPTTVKNTILTNNLPQQGQARVQETTMSSQSDITHPKANPIAVTLAGNNEWGELITQTNLIGLSRELAMNCACEKISDEKVQLSLAPASEHLFKVERLDEVKEELKKLMNNNALLVELEVESSDKETPAECLQRLGFEQQEQTKQNMRKDPGVQALVSEFGAVLNEESIKQVE